jgi:dolichyl-diphosphooligosaccharide--protein glycosyltransferase
VKELDGRAKRLGVRVLAPLGLFVLAVAVRALPADGILVEGRTFFFGNDAYYHMRRIMYSVVHFPKTLGFDPYINYPDGAEAIWTPLFDWSIALLLRPLFGSIGPAALERVAVWIPPVLGAATVVAVYFLALRWFGLAAALIAGGVLSVLSGHFWYSQIGFIDHHAAVTLAATGMLAAAMTLLSPRGRRAVDAPRSWGSAITTGLAFGGALLLWPGMLLHVGLVSIGLLAHLLMFRGRDEAAGFARQLAVVHAVAFGLLLPFALASRALVWGRFSPVVLSAFQPWYFGAATLFCIACSACWRANILSRTRVTRSVVAFGAAAVLMAVSAAVLPGLVSSFGDAWEWFAKQESFQSQVAESKPLFYSREGFTFKAALVRLSTFSLLVPVALLVGFATLGRRRDRAAVRLLLWWSLGLCAATIVQRRFFNSASVAVALLFALSFCGLHARLPARVLARAWSRRTAAAVLVALGVFLLLPVLSSYRPHLVNLSSRWSGDEVFVDLPTRRKFALIQMAGWIRARTPAPSPWLNAGVRPEYGILAPWMLGHVLEYEARRPTVTTNFGDDIGRKNYLLARRYYQSEEAPAAELLDRLRVRYVIAQEAHEYLGEEPLPGSMFHALFDHDGSAFPGSAAGPASPALARHRLIYESRPIAHTDPPSRSLWKVFEYVPGARVIGRAAPGARLRATLPLRTNRRRGVTYTVETVASREGEYEFRLPYANTGGPTGVRAGDAYRIECRGDVGRIEIDEPAVTSGGIVAGPDLCGADTGNGRLEQSPGLL